MAISPQCDICSSELAEFGAILLSPPNNDGLVRKLHVCTACYKSLCETYNIEDIMAG
ncbi:hypothetical protein KC973_00135 [Candidatus Saccharibacteria bacterium]|nr:hypothetical protein [Candidatus Saccharibacteria bacterium]